MADTKTVTIRRIDNVVSVDNLSKSADPGDFLVFTCPDDDFAVFFNNNRHPFRNRADKKRTLCAHAGDSTLPFKIRFLDNDELRHMGDRLTGDTFKYSVAVFRRDTAAILPLDPDIIINDQGGGGGRKKAKVKAKTKKVKKAARKR